MAWTKYIAILSKRADPYNFKVYVHGTTEAFAREKLVTEYPTSKYELVRFFLDDGIDPLSDPNAPKSYK
jgi:hypothetical protein